MSTRHLSSCVDVVDVVVSSCVDVVVFSCVDVVVSSCVDVVVLQKFANWMETEGLWKDDVKSVFVTCGDWDLKTM